MAPVARHLGLEPGALRFGGLLQRRRPEPGLEGGVGDLAEQHQPGVGTPAPGPAYGLGTSVTVHLIDMRRRRSADHLELNALSPKSEPAAGQPAAQDALESLGTRYGVPVIP
jgi:hypothetical protein